jgi:hypothetical protein
MASKEVLNFCLVPKYKKAVVYLTETKHSGASYLLAAMSSMLVSQQCTYKVSFFKKKYTKTKLCIDQLMKL